MFILSMIATAILLKIISGGIGVAILHAIVFWTSWYKIGGSMNSLSSIGRAIGASVHNSIWQDVYQWTGFPLNRIDVGSQGAFICVMILNSLLWGAVIAVIAGFFFGRKK